MCRVNHCEGCTSNIVWGSADAIINMLSTTYAARNIILRYLLLTIHRKVSQRSQDPLAGWKGIDFGQLILRKMI